VVGPDCVPLVVEPSLDAHAVPTIAATATTEMTIAILRLPFRFMTHVSLRIAISRRILANIRAGV
jgi:hypothetical protein